jgi:alkylation response protein AidB-like acyl-CoA dehydrogenase
MADFVADLRDIKFVLFEQLELDKLLGTERYGEFAREDLEMILDESYKFAREVLAPINVPLDRAGCTFDRGKVTIPEQIREVWKLFADNGWLALNHSRAYGGQGAPDCLTIGVAELFFGACISFNLSALLTSGAAHLIEVWGSEALKRVYCQRMYSGEWAGTMCLTEAQAGSDVGASTTRARREGDHYLIEGEKVFITFGEHDLTPNIVHAVLARVEGAPKGTKGLSLFLVPKRRVKPDGSLGELNDVACSGIEHKLGIHGTPTCTMVFGQSGACHGWLLGEENQGMRAMFQMMNEARISVGLQGAALGNAAYQAALSYSRERLQGSDLRNFKDPDAPKVPIIRHPDVRMMLLRQKAYSEGCRALLLFSAFCADRERVAQDDKERARYHNLTEILTPICKAYASDMGFRVTEWALQCFGGYGYIKEYPAEQYLRDAKIASIYEGTNGIQAMDLVARKLSLDGGAPLKALIALVNALIDKHKDHPVLKADVAALAAARDAWHGVNGFFMKMAAEQKLLVPLANASGYLALCGDLLMGTFLVEQAALAASKLGAICAQASVDPMDRKALAALVKDNSEARYLDSKIKTARFFCVNELPAVQARAAAITSGDLSAMAHVWEGE